MLSRVARYATNTDQTFLSDNSLKYAAARQLFISKTQQILSCNNRCRVALCCSDAVTHFHVMIPYMTGRVYELVSNCSPTPLAAQTSLISRPTGELASVRRGFWMQSPPEVAFRRDRWTITVPASRGCRACRPGVGEPRTTPPSLRYFVGGSTIRTVQIIPITCQK